jgi:trans-2,3-dihydro-3-hydroxyanthranilate isomerase
MSRLKLEYHQLDVFTQSALGGNPLGVFPLPQDIGKDQMQALARETNLSETVFLTDRDIANGHFGLRIFTPVQEMVFAGHPTVGSAWYIFNHIAPGLDELILDLPAGPVPVRIERNNGGFVHFSPPPCQLRQTVDDPELLQRLFGLPAHDFNFALAPAQVVVTGPRYLIAPVHGIDALQRASCDIAALRELAQRYAADQATLFCLETYERGSSVSTRMFAPLHGVYEDPATGSSAVCLALYLRSHGLVLDSGSGWFGIDQGYSLQRPSLIHAQANALADGSIAVRIGGHVVPVMSGQYELEL